MHALRSHIALLLLLCLTRTVLPEAWILALHPHTHTTVEPAPLPAFEHKGKALLSAKHQHCEIEQFYSAAFHPALPLPRLQPRVAVHYAALAPPQAARAVVGQLRRPSALRGPPRRA